MFQVCNVLVIKLEHKTQINEDVPWPKMMLTLYVQSQPIILSMFRWNDYMASGNMLYKTMGVMIIMLMQVHGNVDSGLVDLYIWISGSFLFEWRCFPHLTSIVHIDTGITS